MTDDAQRFFTRATWRPSKKRSRRKRVKPWGGQKVAPPALLAAGKLAGIKPGRTNRRICSASKRDGSKCRMLALTGCMVCGAHGGWSTWAKRGILAPTGKHAAIKAEAAAKEDRTPAAPRELISLPIYQQANQRQRMRLIRAYNTPAWTSLISQFHQDKQLTIDPCG